MKIKSLFIALFFLKCFSLSAQTTITANVTQGCAPLAVTFSTNYAGPTYYWDFDDGGGPSGSSSPQRSYSNPKVYNVKLWSSLGGTLIATKTITVYAVPSISLSVNPPISCINTPTSFTATAGNSPGVTITKYKWAFGDFTGDSSVTNTYSPHIYSSVGNFNVTVSIITNMSSCNNTITFPNAVSRVPPPIAGFTPNVGSGCQIPQTVSFTNNSSSLNTKYLWTFSLGSPATSTLQTPPSQTYTVSGTYNISLMVTDTIAGCSSTTSQPITISSQPIASFNSPDTVCINIPVTYTNTSSPGSYTWSFDNSPFSNATNPTVTYPISTYPISGPHSVKLSVQVPGCPQKDTIKQIYIQVPVATFTSIPTYSCMKSQLFTFNASANSSISSWNWTMNNGTNKTGKNITYTYAVSNADSTYVERGLDKYFKTTLVTQTTAGCFTPSVTVTDTIHLPWARFMPDVAQGCAPLTVTFSDSSRSKEPITQWVWDFGDGSPKQTVLPPQVVHYQLPHTYTVSGTYSVSLVVTNSLGCTDTSYFIGIKVGTQKPISFTASTTTVCPGGTVVFSNTTAPANKALFQAWNYSSNGDPLSACYQNPNGSFVFDDSIGPQTITLTGLNNGCPSTATTTVTVKGPIAHFKWSLNCSNHRAVTFTDKSLGATSVSWDFNGDGIADTIATGTFTHYFKNTGDSTVKIIATNSLTGCNPSKDSSKIHISFLKAKFTTDTLLCLWNFNNNFNGSASTDVFANCYRGYTWIFSDPSKRPETYSVPTANLSFPHKGDQTVGLIVEDVNGCKDTAYKKIKVFKPVAQYTPGDTNICFPATAKFIDKTNPAIDTTIISWLWDFGDGTPGSNIKAPATHTYNGVGTPTYTTSLIVTDVVGCKDTATHIMAVYKPTSSISPTSANICFGTSIPFSASDYTLQGSHLAYVWDFGDGTPTSTANPPPPHNYANYNPVNSPQYKVLLKYTEISSGCKGKDDSVYVSVQPYPIGGFSTDQDGQVLCWPQIVNFTDTSKAAGYPLTYNWNLGLGGPVFTGANPSGIVYPKGTHTVTEIVSTTNGCKDTTTRVLNVIGPEGLRIVSSGGTTICKCDAVGFKLSMMKDVSAWRWDFGDGSPLLNLNNPKDSVVGHNFCFFPQQGTAFTVKLTLFGTGGFCAKYGTGPGWNLDTVVNIIDIKAGFKRNTENAGTIDTAVCLGNIVNFTNTSSATANRFMWEFGDGNTSTSTSTVIPYTYNTVGPYTVSLIASNSSVSCKDTAIKKVVILANPTIKAIGDKVCYSDTAHLLVNVDNPNPGFTYLWNNASDLNSAIVKNPYNKSAYVSETYTATVTDTSGCSASDTARVEVIQPLQVINFDTSIVVGDTIMLPIAKQNNQEHFTWTPTTGLSCLDCPFPKVHPLEDITYKVIMQDSCTQSYGTFIIHIKPEMFIALPTTFTPNGDGTNDIIYVKGWGIKELETYEIYNRWGELLFRTTDINEGWNGYYKGVLQNNDTYVYKVKALTWKDTHLAKEGHFNLMR